jgi:hypothetical protein
LKGIKKKIVFCFFAAVKLKKVETPDDFQVEKNKVLWQLSSSGPQHSVE